MRLALALTAALIGAVPAGAEDRAVVIGNSDYRHAPDLAGADMRPVVEGLREAGFRIGDGTDLGSAESRAFLGRLAADDPQPGARIVVLNGRFLHDSDETWFLGREAQEPGLLNVGLQGVPLSLVMRQIAEGRPGAVLLLGTDSQDMPHQPGLDSGIGRLTPPQGVAVITGTPEAVARGMAELMRGSSVARAVAVDPVLALVPGSPDEMVPMPQNRPSPYAATTRERLGGGPPAVMPPQSQPQHAPPGSDAERGLALGSSERAAIQRWLSRLGHEAGMIDGVFGQRTRAALAAWQRANGQPVTGYLTPQQRRLIRQQIDHLDGNNGSRDRVYWQETGAGGSAGGLRRYLRRYPDGIYARTAQRMLDGATGGVTPDLPQGDEATWRWAREQGSVAAYETYLERYPQGRHASEARDHLQTMRATTEAARREEDALQLDASTRRLIEERLRIAGMRPGRIDGEFTTETRAALRRYQGARNLRVTGFVTQETVSSLLSDVLLR